MRSSLVMNSWITYFLWSSGYVLVYLEQDMIMAGGGDSWWLTASVDGNRMRKYGKTANRNLSDCKSHSEPALEMAKEYLEPMTSQNEDAITTYTYREISKPTAPWASWLPHLWKYSFGWEFRWETWIACRWWLSARYKENGRGLRELACWWFEIFGGGNRLWF